VSRRAAENLTELIVLVLLLGASLLCASVLRRVEPARVVRQRTCFWCGAAAVCSSGYTDSCRDHHREHHKPFVVCKTIGE
jgi:hypothetical protein